MDRSSFRIGLLGPFGFGNLGDAAIQEAMISHIRECIPTAEILGFSLNPSDTRERHGIETFSIQRAQTTRNSLRNQFPSRIRYHPFVNLFFRVFVKIPAEILSFLSSFRILGRIDRLFISGGGQLDDYWGGAWGHPYTLLKWTALARLRNIPVLYISVGAGPINSPLGRYFIRKGLSMASYRSYRDRDSKQYIKDIGFSNSQDPVYPDLAYSLHTAIKPVEPETREHGPKDDALIVGIGPMAYFDPRVWPEKNAAVYRSYLLKLTDFTAWLREKGYQVVLFPGGTIADGRVIDDLCRQYQEKYRDTEALTAPAIDTVDELLRQISRCHLVVTSRLHSVILSHLVIRPVLAVSYHRKIDVLMAGLDQSQYCLDIRSFEVTDLIEKFKLLESSRESVCTRLRAEMSAYRQQLNEQYDRISGQSDLEEIGRRIYDLIVELFPICRSITGNGFRTSLGLIQRTIDLDITEVPTGTRVLDWTIPREWNIRDAYILDPHGRKIVDFQSSNLHVLNYSQPVHTHLRLDELRKHLFTLPEFPDWIPYRTSYYNENWGFCLSHAAASALVEGEYEVYIDSTLEDGTLTYAEHYLPGETEAEVLISCHSCHPSLCNDNLSGMALATALASHLGTAPRRYSYRFLFIPGTIGSIAWLARNEDRLSKIRHGLVVACVGDPGHMSYKKSRRGEAEIDRAVMQVLKESGDRHEINAFTPYGYDERQYCSPGYNLPVGSLSRTPHGRFEEYHTSADNLEFVRPKFLADSYRKYLAVFELLEDNRIYVNKNPKGEPQLGRRGLYSVLGGRKDASQFEHAILWVLNLSDGSNSLLDIAMKSGMAFNFLSEAARTLVAHDLLDELDGGLHRGDKLYG